jgi:hypothetical protein
LPADAEPQDRQKKGHYLWPVKDNQPLLKRAIYQRLAPWLFRWKEGVSPPAPYGYAESWDKGHGRMEQRRIIVQRVDAQTAGRLRWPGVRQIFLLVRRRRVAPDAPWTEEVVAGITSLPPAQTSAAELLQLIRGHWGIENRLHYVRDVSFGEDACRVRQGRTPWFLATTRNLAIHLIRQVQGWTNVAAALRRHAAHPQEALALLRE